MAKPCLRTSHGVMSVSGCHERAHARTARSSVANGDAPLEHQGHGREQAALSLPPFPVKVCFHVSQPVAQQQGLVTRLHAHPILMSLIAACQHGRCARAQWKSTRARALATPSTIVEYHERHRREDGRQDRGGARARAPNPLTCATIATPKSMEAGSLRLVATGVPAPSLATRHAANFACSLAINSSFGGYSRLRPPPGKST